MPTPRHLPIAASLVVFVAALAGPSVAHACGGFFCDTLPVEQNAERILFEVGPGGEVTTVVEIAYTGSPEGFSWVVPVLETPALLAVPPSTLRLLDGATVPQIVYPPVRCTGPNNRFGDDDDAAMSDSESGGVDVEDLPQVGPFDPEVVSSDDPQALVAWLNDNGYLITPAMEPYVADYVASGMKFLAMKLAPGAGVADITPIAMTIPGGAPMVPISLTAVAAEPEMGVLVFVAASGRYESANFTNLTIDPEDLRVDVLARSTNYFPLVSYLVDGAGGRAFVTEFAGASTDVRAAADSFFLQAEDAEEARAYLGGVLDRSPVVTRLYTRISGWEMAFDPTFAPAATDAPVARTLDLSGREPIEICGPQEPRPEACGSMYCGPDALCATTDAGREGCVCPDGWSARVVREQDQPGFFLRETVVCQDRSFEFLEDVLGTADGPADPCETAACGPNGSCVAVNGFPTCSCEEGFAAVTDQAGGLVCAAVRKTYGPERVLGTVGADCAGGSCSAGGGAASLGALLVLAPAILRRRR